MEQKEYSDLRHQMWVRLLGCEYQIANKNKKRKMKIGYAGKFNMEPHMIVDTSTVSTFLTEYRQDSLSDYLVSLYDCLVPTTCTKETKEKEKPMAHIYESGLDATQKNYLLSRVSEVYANKNCDLEELYGLHDDKRPQTPKELVDRIAAGKYLLPKDAEDEEHYFSMADVMRKIRWRDPAVKEDKEGYQKAVNSLKTARTNAEDIIYVSDNATGLKALQDFQSATFN